MSAVQLKTDPVATYVADYEFRGDTGDYTPTEPERALLEDAIHGFLAERSDHLLTALDAICSGYPKNSNAHRIASAALAKARGDQ